MKSFQRLWIQFGFSLVVLISSLSCSLTKVASKFAPTAIFEIETQEKVIALTFDDGPSPSSRDHTHVLQSEDTTGQIVNLLGSSRWRVPHKATFFLAAGFVPQNQRSVHAIVSDGHELGNHMLWNRPSQKLFRAEPEQFRRSFCRANKILQRYQSNIRWFRPSHGLYCREWLPMMESEGYEPRFVLGSVLPKDTGNNSSAEDYAEVLIRNLKPGRIFVIHDGKHLNDVGSRAVETLQILLPEMEKQGYRSVTISQLWKLNQNYEN